MSDSFSNPYGNSSPTEPAGNDSVTGTRPLRLKRIDPLSCGMTFGALNVFFGLLVSAFMVVVAAIGIAGAGGGLDPAGVFGGVIGVFIVPVFYGVMGFIGGLALAVLYNLCSAITGGIEMRFE